MTSEPREYDGYYWLGDPIDVRNGGRYIGVEGNLTGHIVTVSDEYPIVESREAVLSRDYVKLKQWREIIRSCGWLDAIVGTRAWRAYPRGRRRALLIEAFTSFWGTDPANEFPDYWSTRVEADRTYYDAIEKYIRTNW